MEAELFPADVVIDAMTLHSREMEDHTPLAVIFSAPLPDQRSLRLLVEMCPESHLFLEFCIYNLRVSRAEARLRARKK